MQVEKTSTFIVSPISLKSTIECFTDNENRKILCDVLRDHQMFGSLKSKIYTRNYLIGYIHFMTVLLR